MSCSDINDYSISSDYKKCTVSIEQWTKFICNKEVTIHIERIWRFGNFVITTNEEQITEMKKNDINRLNKYDARDFELYDECCRYIYIQNEELYNESEMNEINKCLYADIEECEMFDEDTLEEEKGWVIDDVFYEIHGDFTIKKYE